MPDMQVVLTGFLDEAVGKDPKDRKPFDAQVHLAAALGLNWLDLRFLDVGGGTKNVMALDADEQQRARQLVLDHGLRISSIGSPIGKIKLADVADGTNNRYVPLADYLATDVPKAIALAEFFGAPLIRIFSGYPPKGADPQQYWQQALDLLGGAARLAEKAGKVLAVEVEANLVGRSGEAIARLCREVGSPNVCGCWDGANVLVQTASLQLTVESFKAMRAVQGPLMHVKDFKLPPGFAATDHVNEEALRHFVPVGDGDAGYEDVFVMLAADLQGPQSPAARYASFGVPGMFVDLEPHVKGGGQFGGYSGPDGFAIALHALVRELDNAGLGACRRTWADVQAWKDARAAQH